MAQGFLGQRIYIASQGPKPSTIEDFWLMCYERDVKVIVALTSLEERGRVICCFLVIENLVAEILFY